MKGGGGEKRTDDRISEEVEARGRKRECGPKEARRVEGAAGGEEGKEAGVDKILEWKETTVVLTGVFFSFFLGQETLKNVEMGASGERGLAGGGDCRCGGLTRRKVLMLAILLSSMRSRRAFSWLLQYSPYTEKLSLCRGGEKRRVRIVAG